MHHSAVALFLLAALAACGFREPSPAPGASSSLPGETPAQLSLDGSNSCLLRNRTVWCWGQTPGAQPDGMHPVGRRVPGLRAPVRISATGGGLYALETNGIVMRWGHLDHYDDGSDGETGAVAVSHLPAARALDGHRDPCVLTDKGVYRWGSYAPMMGGGEPPSKVPLLVAHPRTPANIGCYDGNLCTLEDGEVNCTCSWFPPGLLRSAELPDLRSDPIVEFAVNTTHICGITRSRRLACDGRNYAGENGQDPSLTRDLQRSIGPAAFRPAFVAGLPPVEAVALGGMFTCALVKGGTVYCFGDFTWGQSGDGRSAPQKWLQEYAWATSQERDSWDSQPRPVPRLQHVIAIGAGASHACAFDDKGATWCWGRNLHGEVGTAVQGVHPSPVKVELE